jgi:hypothetical protein
VVGVVAEKLNAVKFAKVTGDIPQNVNFAIKTGAVRDFLDNSVVAYQSGEPGTELKTADIAKSARAYTMLISCSAKSEHLVTPFLFGAGSPAYRVGRIA